MSIPDAGSRRRRTVGAVLFLGVAIMYCPALAAEDAGAEFFEKKIRPILFDRCFECHGRQPNKVRGGLRVDSLAGLLQGGDTGPAVVPKDSDNSLLIQVVDQREPYAMPPKSKLPPAEIAALKEWIRRGAPWPAEPKIVPEAKSAPFDVEARRKSHWAWRPVQRPDVPATKNDSWPTTEVDRFLLAKLEARQLAPAGPIDRAGWLRRVSFDLIGLPPSPEEATSFAEDRSSGSFEKVVDRLLASPHFGEHWGRHWLDLVRYAETRGHEHDPIIPNAWQYRDYVIRALNADVPFDRFVVEHLAGDLLSEPRRDPTGVINESMLGTGFWFLGEEVHSPVDIRQDEADRLDNRIDVMTKAILGLTVSCARCHDHKFDAISQEDYYALVGFALSAGYRQTFFEHDVNHRKIAEGLEDLRPAVRSLLRLAGATLLPAARRSHDPLREAVAALARRSATKDALESKTGAPAAGETRTLSAAAKSWLAELDRAKATPRHPLAALARMATRLPADASPTAFQESLREALKELETETAQPLSSAEECQSLLDFADASAAPWFAEGFAFGMGPRTVGDAVFSDDLRNPLAMAVSVPAAMVDPIWKSLVPGPANERDHGALGGWDRAGRTLRTRKVELKSGVLWYLTRGSGRAYAVVDSHLLVAGPLHQRVLLEWTAPPFEWRWIRHDLSEYRGHRAHVEFSPKNEPFDLSLAKVVDGTAPPSAAPDPGVWIRRRLAANDPRSMSELVVQFQSAFEETLEALATGSLSLSADVESRIELADWLIRHASLVQPKWAEDQKIAELARRIGDRRQELGRSIKPSPKTAMAMYDGNGLDERLLIRGNVKTPGAVVSRRFLTALGGANPGGYGPGSGRLELARQIVANDNPLFARVIVNRVWRRLFGRGIVATVDNFGVLGQPPTHPELLDFLAHRFIHVDRHSLKSLIRYLVLSSAYRMSSDRDAGRGDRSMDSADLSVRAFEIDPDNRLLHHMPLRRLPAESIRDAMLAATGQLESSMFGPPVEVHLTPFMEGRGRPATSGPVDGMRRRSVYLRVRRNFLSPFLLAFDMPIPFTTFGSRNAANVPAQSLAMMNDPFVVEQAKRMAVRVCADEVDDDRRIEALFLRTFSRRPIKREIELSRHFLETQFALHAEALSTKANIAAGSIELPVVRVWADLAHALFNAKEFLLIP